MQVSFLKLMRCKICRRSNLLTKDCVDYLYDGAVTCANCGAGYEVKRGIFKLKIDNPKVLREVSQWEKFAESEGWIEEDSLYLESLPSAGSNLLKKSDTIGWMSHEYNFFSIIKELNLKGMWVLDLGAGRCWSSKWLTLSGANVVAFDAMEHPTLGLGAGEIFINTHKIYFDRVSGDFNDLPFDDGVFDIVFSTGSMHHSIDLSKTLSEAARVLKVGGKLAIVNEPVGSIRVRNESVKLEGDQNGINEHEYRITRYIKLFKLNKLKMDHLRESINVYDRKSYYYQGVFSSLINRTKLGRLLYLILIGGVLNMVATKQ